MSGPGRSGARYLAAAALLLGYSATAACSNGSVAPTAPSPGLDSSHPPSPITRQTTSTPSTTGAPTPRDKPGIELTAVPRPDGSFDVTESLILPEATNVLPLHLPASGEHLAGLMARTTPRVTNLKMVANGQSVPLDNTTLTESDDVPLTAAANRIQLTYRLSGSTVRATPSQSHRAGAAIRPLTASAESTLPTDITVTSGLLNAVCPLLAEIRCAVGDPPHLTIRPAIPSGKALVVLQLDLPR